MDATQTRNLEDLEKIFHTRMQAYEEKLQQVATEGTPAHTDVTSLAREYNEFKTFVWQALSMIKSQIGILLCGQDRHETAMRRKVLLLHGVPEKANENTLQSILRVLSEQMSITDVTAENIIACHRLGSSQSKTCPVLVRFLKMEHRHLVWDNKTSLKGSGITVSEFLTKVRHGAFTTARRHFGIKNCWTVEGKILVVLPDKSRPKLESMAEVQSLISAFPDVAGQDADSAGGASIAGPTSQATASKGTSGTTAKTSRSRRRV